MRRLRGLLITRNLLYASLEGFILPTIAYFLGIAVAMYYRDHNPPHIHVFYQGMKR
jgi:hypothetical protein